MVLLPIFGVGLGGDVGVEGDGVGDGDGDGDGDGVGDGLGVDPHSSHVFLQRSLMRGLLHPYFCFHRGQTKIEDVKC